MNKSDIIAANLARLDVETVSITERRAAHITELARLLYESEKDYVGDDKADGIRECFEAMRPPKAEISCADFNRRAAECSLALNCAPSLVQLCRYFLSLHGGALKSDIFLHGDAILHGDRVIHDDSGELSGFRTAYLRNAYTDLAYRRFSEALPELTCIYFDDFAAVAEEVYYGRARFCIMPIESSADGRLSTFRTLIVRYDLKVALTCRVQTGESSYTVFALLRKNADRLSFRGQERYEEYFEFTVTLSDPTTAVADIFTAAKLCSMKLHRIDSVPAPYGDDEYVFDIVFNTRGGDLECFLCYLTIETPQFTPMGIYTHLL